MISAKLERDACRRRRLRSRRVDAAVGGPRGAGPTARAGEQRGHAPGSSAFMDITDEKWDRHHPGQPQRSVLLHPGRGARHGRGRLGAHRQHLVVERAGRPAVHGPLRHVEGRDDRHDQERWRSSSARSGITVNTIPPGFIDTPMLRIRRRRATSAARSTTSPTRRRSVGSAYPRTSRRRARSSVGRGQLRDRSDHRRQRRTVTLST